MNDPIISPWVFYLISKVDVVSCTSFMISIILIIIWAINYTEESNDLEYTSEYFVKKRKRAEGIRKHIQKFILIPIIIALITPSSKTLTKMIIASQVTPHNIEVVGDTIEHSVDYIFDKINEVVDKREVE